MPGPPRCTSRAGNTCRLTRIDRAGDRGGGDTCSLSRRRARIALPLFAALGVALVIPLWAGLGLFESSDSPAGAGHLASHGHGGDGGESIGNASAAAAEFNEEHTRPDGCVDPDYHGEGAAAEATAEATQDHAHGGDEDADKDSHTHPGGGSDSDATTVYVQAYSYGYLPERLCLKAGKPYHFKLVAIDVTHGWTIQLGTSSSVMRLPPGVVVERELTFTKPGTYLVYCSYYCGLGHPQMEASIVVEPERAT